MKKCNQCSDGGFVALQTKILEDGKIQCPACSELLSVCGFQPEDLSRFIARLEENGPQSNAEPDGKETEAKAAKADDANEKEATDPASKEEQADAFAYVRQFAPDIELLQPGDYGKKFGYRCRICTSKNYPQGKIGELHAAKPYAVKHFLEQHMNSVTHQRQLAAKKKASEEDLVPCAGISVKDPRSGHLYALRQEFSLWSQFTNFEAHAKHKYRREANSEEGDVWYITSASCKGRCKPLGDAVRPVCDACVALTDSHAVPRNVARFGVKYYAACLLSARLFLPKADQNAVELEIQQSGLYQKDQKKMDNILRMRADNLQQFVRASICSEHTRTDAMKQFISTVVTPSLRVNVASVSDRLASTIAQFSACISAGNFSDLDTAALKVAVAAISGDLDEHPMILGLALQCQKKLQREKRGITSMCGRKNSHETEREQTLIAEAGMQLAITSGNSSLLREFGMNLQSVRVSLDILEENSLPTPALALWDANWLKENFIVANQRFRQHPGSSRCDLDILGYYFL